MFTTSINLQKIGEDDVRDSELSVGFRQSPLGVFEIDLTHADSGDVSASFPGGLQTLMSGQLGLFKARNNHGQLFVCRVQLLLAFVPTKGNN